MLKPYQTIEDVLASPWARQPQAERMERTDRVLRSTKLENNIYHDLRAEDTAMDEINRTVTEQLEIPAITVETLRTEPLAQRVRNHLEIVKYVLQYENML